MWSWMSWVVYLVFLAVGGFCVKQAFDGYEHRESTKHKVSRKEARVMLYRLIGWAALGLLVWVAGIAISEFPY